MSKIVTFPLFQFYILRITVSLLHVLRTSNTTHLLCSNQKTNIVTEQNDTIGFPEPFWRVLEHKTYCMCYSYSVHRFMHIFMVWHSHPTLLLVMSGDFVSALY